MHAGPDADSGHYFVRTKTDAPRLCAGARPCIAAGIKLNKIKHLSERTKMVRILLIPNTAHIFCTFIGIFQ